MHTRGKDTRIHRSASRCMIADHLAYPHKSGTMRSMVWSISDLHLSFARPKPMDIFGSRWKDHPERIAAAWRARVKPDDVVLLAGDTSWAMKLQDALVDLQWIAALPGRKIISRGNHDYWWSSERTNRCGVHSRRASIFSKRARLTSAKRWCAPHAAGIRQKPPDFKSRPTARTTSAN